MYIRKVVSVWATTGCSSSQTNHSLSFDRMTSRGMRTVFGPFPESHSRNRWCSYRIRGGVWTIGRHSWRTASRRCVWSDSHYLPGGICTADPQNKPWVLAPDARKVLGAAGTSGIMWRRSWHRRVRSKISGILRSPGHPLCLCSDHPTRCLSNLTWWGWLRLRFYAAALE